MDNLSLLGEYWTFSLIVAGSIYGFFRFFGDHLADTAKTNLSLWLWGEYESTWSSQFCQLFDRVFGNKHFHWKCFLRSCIASAIAVLFLYVLLGPLLGLLEDRVHSDMSLGQVLLLGMLLNFIPDYISLYETRWLLKRFERVKTFWGHVLILMVDAIVTGLIFIPAILIYQFIMGIDEGLIHTFVIFSVTAVFFYSTFFTSVWAWFYCISTGFVKLFSKTPLKNILDIEKSPHKSIGLVSAGLALVVAFTISPMVNLKSASDTDQSTTTSTGISTFDQFLCDFFPGTCSKVADLTDDKFEATRFLIKGCKGGETDLCGGILKKYKKVTDSVPLFEQACKSQDLDSCVVLASMYYRGVDIPQDYDRALDLFQQACSGGSPSGCGNLENHYLDTAKPYLWPTQDYDRVREIYQQACDAGVFRFCMELGYLYEKGEASSTVEIHRARELYQKACDGGYSQGCLNLAALEQELQE